MHRECGVYAWLYNVISRGFIFGIQPTDGWRGDSLPYPSLDPHSFSTTPISPFPHLPFPSLSLLHSSLNSYIFSLTHISFPESIPSLTTPSQLLLVPSLSLLYSIPHHSFSTPLSSFPQSTVLHPSPLLLNSS